MIGAKPYTSFDRTRYKNGPIVDSISYGTIVGGDSDFRKLRHGWVNVQTPYIGYFGSQISHKGVDTSLNGGLLGLTETFYKGNFFTALTASVGAGAAESHAMYGKDDIAMIMAGIASKNGYNIEFAEGKFIIQPLLKLEYTMVNSFDYTNAAGVKIDSDPLHTIQLNPSVRFISNLKEDLQAYAMVGMVYNLMNESNTMANGVTLPRMHLRPYVEYGVGIQKAWNNRFGAFGQATVRNGHRTGVALTFGFRWALDSNTFNKPKKQEKVYNNSIKTATMNVPAFNVQQVENEKYPSVRKTLTKEDIKFREAAFYRYNEKCKAMAN